MLEGLAQLLALQRLDDELAAFEKEHGGLPERREQIEQRLAQAEADAADAAGAQTSAEAALRAAETALQNTEAELTRLENQTFQVKSNEAYTALLREIENAKVAISDRETGILEAMDAIETATQSKSAADAALSDAKAALETECTSIDARECELRERIEQHRAGRMELGPKVDPELLKHYERIAKRRSPAVVVVNHELCGGCRVGIPAQDFIEIRRGERIVTCGNCKRILLLGQKVESEAAG